MDMHGRGSNDDAPSTSTEIAGSASRRGREWRSFLYLVMEAERPLSAGARYALDVPEVIVGRGSHRDAQRSGAGPGARLTILAPSRFLSGRHCRFFRTNEGSWHVEDLASKNGVVVNGTPIDHATPVGFGDVVAAGGLLFLLDQCETDAAGDTDLEDAPSGPAGLLSLDPSLMQRFARLREKAARDVTITIVGETGTGKEILARAIHQISGRQGTYVAINCGAIPRELIQSELFGHVKGAFTGAVSERSGRIRDAGPGTVLLDEVVHAPPEVQIAFLRMLQEREVIPVGGKQTYPIAARFLAAAQLPLDAAVAEGSFRRDLQARLQGFVFDLPPLRSRLQDVGLFVATALKSIGVKPADEPSFTYEAAAALLAHDWPMNIRELAQAIATAWEPGRSTRIDRDDLPAALGASHAPDARNRRKQQILAHLKATGGNVAEAARRMGCGRTLLYHWLEKLAIDPKVFRS